MAKKKGKVDVSHRGMRAEHPANEEAAAREAAIAAGRPWRGQRESDGGSSSSSDDDE